MSYPRIFVESPKTGRKERRLSCKRRRVRRVGSTEQEERKERTATQGHLEKRKESGNQERRDEVQATAEQPTRALGGLLTSASLVFSPQKVPIISARSYQPLSHSISIMNGLHGEL